MNCREVEAMVTDLARDYVLEGEFRDRALAHVEQCLKCGERLAREKWLTEGLRGWAIASNGEQAPPRVEEKLRAAFAIRRQPGRHGRAWVVLSAAASITAAILLFKSPSRAPAPPPPVPVPVKIASVAVQAPAPVVEIKRKRRQANRLPRPQAPAAEIATEFLPVAGEDGWTPLDGGRLVRVKLPRSALGVFGLPVDEERGPERVQADVMLSNDGILRAIRFVR